MQYCLSFVTIDWVKKIYKTNCIQLITVILSGQYQYSMISSGKEKKMYSYYSKIIEE